MIEKILSHKCVTRKFHAFAARCLLQAEDHQPSALRRSQHNETCSMSEAVNAVIFPISPELSSLCRMKPAFSNPFPAIDGMTGLFSAAPGRLHPVKAWRERKGQISMENLGTRKGKARARTKTHLKPPKLDHSLSMTVKCPHFAESRSKVEKGS
jgi:hypothetical protein